MMDHNDHVNLLKLADIKPGGSWADLGAGSGAFTFATRELTGPTASIYAIDKDRANLNELERAYRVQFGNSQNLNLIVGDFSHPLDTSTSSEQRLPALDGIVMANSLHFFKNKEKILRHVGSYLKPNGQLLIVEYNVDSGNPWVPYPFSFETYCKLAPRANFTQPRLLARVPSRFLREFYSAACNKNDS
jgi:ubiquinone/menaquinone biosynthesis C-methylase UbiE